MKKTKLLALLFGVLALFGACSGCLKRDRGENEAPLTPDTVRIHVVSKGYGADWEREVAKGFTAKTGIPAAVVETGQDDGYPGLAVQNPSLNQIDIFFPTENYVFSQLAQNNFVPGYEKAWADLTDVYEAPAEGYKELQANPGLKIKDIVNKEIYDAFTYKDSKQYMMGYATSVCGLLYNKKLWGETNAKLGGEPLALPRTTAEMDALFKRIKDLRDAGTTTAYAYTYSGGNDYTEILINGWWAQYDGKEKAYAALEGKYLEYNPATGIYDDKGYSPKIFDTDGRQYAFQSAINMFKTGYTDTLDSAKSFTLAQVGFLQGDAFFMANGDWLEREASRQFNPEDTEIEFIKLPVVSQIVNHPAITANDTMNEAQLSGVIKWIDDGEPAGSKPAFHEKTLNFLRDARKFNGQSQAFARVAHIPVYSPRLESAKKFLKYMYSKEGQEIMMKKAYGTMCPINADMSQFDYYSQGASAMAKSKLNLFQNSYAFGANNATPMQYLGKLSFNRFQDTNKPHAWTNAAAIRSYEYNLFNSGILWADMMSKAGVSN